MGERLKKYLKRTEELIEYLTRMGEGKTVADSDANQDVRREREDFRSRVAKEKAELLIQIGFFQHERLIHLIVTALFALLSIMVFLLVVLAFSPWAAVLFLLLFALLIAYIKHYWLLENGTQKLYQYYDKLEDLYNGKN